MSGMASECGFGARCRGMLVAPVQGVTAGVYGATEGRQGVDHNPPNGFPRRADIAGCAGGAGSSRSQRRRSKGGDTERENPFRSRIEALPLLVSLLPTCI